MKKTLLLLSILLTIPSLSFATSGACSYHNGVNCSAGASYTGKVQCNDGWINSSVNFSEAQECKVSHCNYPTYSSCDVERAKQQAQARIASRQVAAARNGLLGSSFIPSSDYTQDSDYVTCKLTQDLYQSGVDYYNQCLKDESDVYIENQKKIDAEYQIKYNSACSGITGVGSVYTKDGCIAPFKLITESLPDAVVNKEYSVEIKFTQDDKVKETPLLRIEEFPDSFYSVTANSNGSYGIFPIRLTPRKVGQFTFKATVFMNNATVVSKTFSLNVVDENKTEILTTTTKTTSTTTTQKFFFSVPSNNDLADEASFTRTLKKGMSGNDVKQLQTFLQKLNYISASQTPSTYFGTVTNNAVIKFQKDNKIQPATGLFGPMTQKIFIQKLKGVITQ